MATTTYFEAELPLGDKDAPAEGGKNTRKIEIVRERLLRDPRNLPSH